MADKYLELVINRAHKGNFLKKLYDVTDINDINDQNIKNLKNHDGNIILYFKTDNNSNFINNYNNNEETSTIPINELIITYGHEAINIPKENIKRLYEAITILNGEDGDIYDIKKNVTMPKVTKKGGKKYRKKSRKKRSKRKKSSLKKRRKGSCRNKRKSRSCRRSKKCSWTKRSKRSKGHCRKSKNKKR